MRIFQIISSLDREAAGPSYSVPRLARALGEAGHDSSIMTLGKPGCDRIMDVPLRRFRQMQLSPLPLAKLRLSPALRAGLAAAGPTSHIFHTHGLWTMPNVYPSAVADPVHTGVVVSPRGMLSSAALAYSRNVKRVFWALRQRAALETSAMLHATSEQEYNDIRAAGLTPPVCVIPNGIDLPDLSGANQAAPNRPSTILFLGRLHPIKRIETLIAAWGDLEPQFDGWRLEILGPGESDYIATLHRLVTMLGITRCHIGGPEFGAAKKQAFRNAALTVLPSASENFGMTVAESLACATPVIATIGTPWQGLRENRCGWWVEQGKEPLKAALAKAMSLPAEELTAMGARGRSWMERDFGWDAISARMAEAYVWCLGRGSRPDCVVMD